jgi:regulator of sigma E protease
LLRLAFEAAEAGGGAGCVLNAADEIAVAAFLAREIPYTGYCFGGGKNVGTLRRPARLAWRKWRAGSRGPSLRETDRRPDGVIGELTKVMGFLENSLAFIFVLGVMVLIHELGHFLAARYFDVRVDSFSFGFGPRLIGFRRGETDYKICLLPLGGYVKMAGESIGEPTDDPREFLSKPRWQRLIIAAMGPIFNGVLAVGLLAGLFMAHYERFAFWTEPAVIAKVDEGSPAERAGIQAGDLIVAFDGQRADTWEAFGFPRSPLSVRSVPVLIERDGQRVDFQRHRRGRRAGRGPRGLDGIDGGCAGAGAGSPASKAGVRRGRYCPAD